MEIVKQGKKAIKNYFENLKKSQEVELFEAKLLIVGEGDVGKTSLMKKLIDPNIDISKEKTTEGIDIRRWDVKTNKTNDFRINIWDFGGQEIYHSTHQFFLTKRSLYLFVWEARKDTDILSFDYWLNTIRILTNESPIIVVLNKTDERLKTIDEKTIQEKFPNIIGFFKVSAKTGAGIDELSQIIRSNIENLPHVGSKLPKTWIDIRKKLEDLNKNYINYIEYEDICKEYYLNEEKSMFLSRYYHDLGVFLNFNDNTILKEIIFLKPEWATDAVYKVLDTKEILLKKGKFNLTDIELIWKGYPKTQHKNLLELMKKFELCFKIPEVEEYIIPELLPQARPDFNWEYKDNLRFEYQYDFMPAGIMPRFIVITNHLIDNNTYWKYGVILKYEGAKALIISEPLNRKIKIFIDGIDKKNLLSAIREKFYYIHKTLNFPPLKEMIPCCCEECKKDNDPQFFNYNILKNYKNKGKQTIECQKTTNDVNISKLLEGIEDFYINIKEFSQKEPIMSHKKVKIFLASGKDMISDREAVELLVNRSNNRLIDKNKYLELVLWEDLKHSFAGDKIQDYINTEMSKCDIVIVLFSDRVGDFTKEEFELAYKNFKARMKPHYLYVYFKDVDFKANSQNRAEFNELCDLKDEIFNKYQQIFNQYDTKESLILQLTNQFQKIIEEI